jgi:hypothetical protein
MELENTNKALNEKLREANSKEAEVKKLRQELKLAQEAQPATPDQAKAQPPQASQADHGDETLSGRAMKQVEIKMRQLTRENEQLKNNINTLRENLRAIMTSKH